MCRSAAKVYNVGTVNPRTQAEAVKGGGRYMDTPNSAELISKLSHVLALRVALELVKECNTLEEYVDKLEAMIAAGNK